MMFHVHASFIWLISRLLLTVPSSTLLLARAFIHVAISVTEPSSSSASSSFFSYKVLNGNNQTLFDGGDIAVFLDGRWCVTEASLSKAVEQSSSYSSSSVQPLILVREKPIRGTVRGLGGYHGVKVEWTCQLARRRADQRSENATTTMTVPVVTSFLNFDSQQSILFQLEWPEGGNNTNLLPNIDDPDQAATLATFPSFQMTKKLPSKPTTTSTTPTTLFVSPLLPSTLSWQGSFVQSVRGLSRGSQGGPTVFYNGSDSSLETVIVGSPFGIVGGSSDHHSWSSFTAGNGRDWTGRRDYFSPGTSGRVSTIPAGFRQSYLLYEGRNGGITATLQEWGRTMRKSRRSSKLTSWSSSSSSNPSVVRNNGKINDVTLEKIGVQTDNGAFYCFCQQSNCSDVLLKEKEYLDSVGIPVGYLSFQGAGTSSGRGQAAPWCVERWSADGGQDRQHYPLGIEAFQQALGVPLQLYAPYFCPNTTYFGKDKKWQSVKSNPALPTCTGFSFETVAANDSKDFFTSFMKMGISSAGMASFESDFMNQNINCVDDFVRSVSNADTFLGGMASAALDLDIPIQWCYATPNEVFASLDFPAVTNFRVSFDFCYGQSYNVGESSLLVWALGAAPSKDTLWTTDNNKTAIPGCPWTDDHEAVAAELHVVLALMSTGPVGISDAIGMTNETLLQRVIAKDGSLLQPMKPITAVDSTFLDNTDLDGYVYGTYGLGPSWIFVSFQLQRPYAVTLQEFWPLIKVSDRQRRVSATSVSSPLLLAYRSFSSDSDCRGGLDAVQSGCVTMVSLGAILGGTVFVAPQSSFVSPGSDLSPNVVTVWQGCAQNGIFFLGELHKYVSLSPRRFHSLLCTDNGVRSVVKGSAGEVVELTVLIPRNHAVSGETWYEVITKNVTIKENDSISLVEFSVTDPLKAS